MKFVSGWATRRLQLFAGATVCSLLAVSATAYAQTNVRKSVTYFTIHGKTAADIDRGFARGGPEISDKSRHPGAAQIRFAGDISYREVDGHCMIAKTRVNLTLKIILPRWADRRTASSSLGILWDSLASDIKRHEERHAEIAVQHARQLDAALKALPPQRTCKEMQALANSTTDKQIALHDLDQQRFDRVEMVNFESRITRLIQYRTMQASAGH